MFVRRKQGARGFSLAELITVVAIIGVLASVALPVARFSIRRQKEIELKSRLRKITEAIDRYHELMTIPEGTPPIFLAHGGDDLISSPEHSVLMYLALRKAGVSTELHVYASTAHDFGVRAADRPYSTWTDSCVKWLEDQKLLEP